MATSSKTRQLPIAGLLALAMTGFIAILTETMPAGLLPQIGAGLHVSPALTGQLIGLYAFGSLVAAIPVTRLCKAGGDDRDCCSPYPVFWPSTQLPLVPWHGF